MEYLNWISAKVIGIQQVLLFNNNFANFFNSLLNRDGVRLHYIDADTSSSIILKQNVEVEYVKINLDRFCAYIKDYKIN